jgi:transcriptional regulator with PAS, ATPase and Fis domain
VQLPIELQSLVDIYDQPFVVIDPGYRVFVVNKAFEETYGVGRDEAVGRRCYALVPHTGRPCPCSKDGEGCPFRQIFQRGMSTSSVHAYRDAEGRDHIVRVQAYPLRTASGELYLGALIQKDAVRHHPDSKGQACPGGRMVGNSPAFRQTIGQLMLAAGSVAPVLLLGETGTGKEMAAAYIHRQSARRDGPFQTLDCTALTDELFESEVFGHERGAFTGSVGAKPGLYELADKGTLFLDEIGEMSLPLQAKLLRVLETGQFRRVGGVETRSADVRIICATNRDVRDANWFRNDLYYRIACVTVRLPSLRERPSDIPDLARELLQRIGQSSGQQFSIADEALDLLMGYDLPGNVRELRNILWVAAVNSPDGRISKQLIAAAIPEGPNGSRHGERGLPVGAVAAHASEEAAHPVELRPRLPIRRHWEAEHIALVLSRHKGNRRAVADELGVSERTIYRKLREFNLS